MNVVDFKSECLILCKDAKKGDEISGFNELFKHCICFLIDLISILL